MKKVIAALALLTMAALSGCTTKATEPPPAQAEAKAKAMVNISAADLQKRLQSGEKPLIVDVRTPEEFAEGRIAGAKLIPLQTIEEGIKAVPDKKQEIILVCRSGNRSAQAYQILAAMGYSNLKNMEGGMIAWEKLGFPVSK